MKGLTTRFKLLPVFLLLLITTACGATEIEKRAFAASIGIDVKDGETRAAVSIPKYSGKGGEIEWTVKDGEGGELNECLINIDEQLSGKLFLGHIKTVIFGSDLIKDYELFKKTVEFIDTDERFGRGVIALRADGDAKDVIKAEAEKEKNGFYVSDYFKNGGKKAPKVGAVRRALFENEQLFVPVISSDDLKAR